MVRDVGYLWVGVCFSLLDVFSRTTAAGIFVSSVVAGFVELVPADDMEELRTLGTLRGDRHRERRGLLQRAWLGLLL